jgi:hypothetical protein
VLNPILFIETAVPFINTVEFETVALKVAVSPATGKAAVQLLLLFQELFAPFPVQAPLAAEAGFVVNIELNATARMPSVIEFFFIGS